MRSKLYVFALFLIFSLANCSVKEAMDKYCSKASISELELSESKWQKIRDKR